LVLARGSDKWLPFASGVALAVGAALRLVEYLSNRPLNIDESFLALNLLEKSPVDLLGRLDFNQAAPLGFLEAEKLATAVFGKTEYALRLFPLLGSLVALFFFYRAAKELVHAAAVPLACAAFALLDPLIFYGATAKQYSLDVTAAVTLYAIVVSARPGRMTRGEIARFAVLGAVIVWFSHAAVFVLAAIGITLAARAAKELRWDWLPGIAMAVAAWAISFGIESFLSRANLESIQRSFGGSGVILTTGSAGSTWFGSATAKVRYLVGLEDAGTGLPILGSLPSSVNQGLTVLLVVVAAFGFLALAIRRTRSAILLGLPPVFALVASAMHKYPLVGRTLLFLLPAVALCLGEGLRIIFRKSPVTGGMVAALSLIAIGLLPAVHFVRPQAGEGMRPALRDLGLHYRGGDTLYVGHSAQYGLVYYHLCGCASFDPAKTWPFATTGGPGEKAPALVSQSPNLVLGDLTRSSRISRGDLRQLLGRGRVWILISETPESEVRSLLVFLSRFGRKEQQFSSYGFKDTAASLYLYDLPAGASRG